MSELDRPFNRFDEPGKAASAGLAVLMHALLLLVLFFGVRWQSHQPEAVSVELWTAPPSPALAVKPPPPAPKPEPVPPPKVEPIPPPPAPAAKPEPQVENPDIAIEKARQEKLEQERREAEARLKREQDLKAKQEAERLERERQAKEEAARKERQAKEQAERAKREDERRAKEAADRQREVAEQRRQIAAAERKFTDEQLARELGGARVAGAQPSPGAASGDSNAYAAKIKAKIRPNIILPPDMAGNPEAVFDVQQLPTGEVVSVRLRKSSGVQAYDDAVERAIYKSSPLPKPDNPQLFARNLELKFRPKE